MGIDFGREICGDLTVAAAREWLVTNGIGGYASGTVAGLLTRRYHGLLVNDACLRPNQIFAVSLPASPLTTTQQRGVVNNCARSRSVSVGESLLTSHGLRSLSPDDPQYQGQYGGDPRQRDGAYHQGTVWGWLIGPFVLAHLRVYGNPTQACKLLEPMANHLCAHGVGSLGEIFDGNAPMTPRGCIAQAWTVAEVLRAWLAIHNYEDYENNSP